MKERRSGAPTAEELEKVIAALEDNKYDWRTISGITSDTRLPEDIVKKALDELMKSNRIVQGEKGYPTYPVYTTRAHYMKRDVIYRLQSAISDIVR